ncbi:MAG TPA: hypothetical protein VEK13_07190 [Thermoplasmata archaeon]|nr:hypothetical protein [Thermoplasmata archaeon]
MLGPLETPVLEHLTPHELVTYFRCPYEMELARQLHARSMGRDPPPVRTPLDVVPLHHSPMFAPPLGHVAVNEGCLDLAEADRLVYEDDGEDDLPVLFPPDRIHRDPRFLNGHSNLIDPELGLSGRPDLVIQRESGEYVPLEYKATHLFIGYHEAHGRLFDTVQAIAECRLVHAVFGRRPSHGIVLYGDAAGGGEREGWVEIPYGDAEERWLHAVVTQIRTDRVRAPVPAERNCGGCEPNAEGLCRFAASRFEGPHHRQAFLATPRPRL